MNKITICSYDELFLPVKKSSWDVCWDLKIAEDLSIESNKLKTIWTWIKISLPIWWQAKVHARSSLPVKNWLMQANSVAIFDANYRWEYIIQYYNFTDNKIEFEKWTRLSQMEFQPYYVWSWQYGTSDIPDLEFIVDKNIYDNFSEIYSSDRWEWKFWSTWAI